jgi:hypothetical protein
MSRFGEKKDGLEHVRVAPRCNARLMFFMIGGQE